MTHIYFHPYIDEPEELIMCGLTWREVPTTDDVIYDMDVYEWDRDREEMTFIVDTPQLCNECLDVLKERYD